MPHSVNAEEQEARRAAMQDDARRFDTCGGRPTNKNEGECWDRLTLNGFFMHRRGWPDFLCEGRGTNGERRLFAVEVKRHPGDEPRTDQLWVLALLESAGIPCFVWDRHSGFRRAGSICFDGEWGRQPGDAEMADPAIPRCEMCWGSGTGLAIGLPEAPKCEHCDGTGLAIKQIQAVT